MPVRRINSTGRQRIRREHAQVIVHPGADGLLTFEASLNLRDYELPAESQVSIEAYRQTAFMRFPHGTAASPVRPAGLDYRLTEFSTTDALLFRVKITSTGERPGLLLAEGDRIPVHDADEWPANRVALLPPAPQDLGQEVWQLDGLTSESGPVLLLNSRLPDWKETAASPLFRALVYPTAMREVLWHIYKIEETRNTDDEDDWRCRWLVFAASLPGVGEPPVASQDDSEWLEWIAGAVESFARRHRMLDCYVASVKEAIG